MCFVEYAIHTGVKLFNWGKQYAQFRPTYPDHLYKAIWNYAPKKMIDGKNNLSILSYSFPFLSFSSVPSGSKVALDVGTGTGQVAAEIAPKFFKVIGRFLRHSEILFGHFSLATDPSQSMLDAAIKKGMPYISG